MTKSAQSSTRKKSARSSARSSVKISSSKSSARGSAQGSARASAQGSASDSEPKFSIDKPPLYQDTQIAQQAVWSTPFPPGPPSTYKERNEAYHKERKRRQIRATRLYNLWASSSTKKQSISLNRAIKTIEEEKPRTKCNLIRDRVKFFQQIYDRNPNTTNETNLRKEQKKLDECKEEDQEEEDDEVFYNRVEQQAEIQAGLNAKIPDAPILRGVKIIMTLQRPTQADIDRFDDRDTITNEPLRPETSMMLSDGHCYSDDEIIRLYDAAHRSMVEIETMGDIKGKVDLETFIRKEKPYFRTGIGVGCNEEDVRIAATLKNLKKIKNSANGLTRRSAKNSKRPTSRSSRR